MYLFDIASLPIDLVGDLDRFEERLGAFFTARDFPMRLIAHSTAFPMHEPVAAVRESIHRIESLYVRTRTLREAIDAWCLDHDAVNLAAALHALGERERGELAAELGAIRPDLPASLDGSATAEQWEAFVAAVDLVFWRIPWAREAVRMYEVMERRVLRAVQYILLTWEPADVSEMAIRVPLAAATRRPVRRIDYLPPVIAGPYREHLAYLAPEEPEQPFLAVLTSYDFAGEWNATLFHELIALNLDITIAVDVVTLNRNKSQRVAEMAYNAAKLVARDHNLVDIRGEQVVEDAREVLGQLKGQTLHAIQVAILVRGKTREELEANVVTVRDLFGPRLKLLRPSGAQSAALKLFSTLPRKRLEAPWKPRTQLSKVIGCAAGMVGFHRPNQTKGVFVGVDRNGRFPIFINLFERNQAAHMIIAGMSGHGKTVLLNFLAERAASLGDMQVIGIDAFSNGLRVERAIQDCTCFKVGLEHTINPLDIVFGWETEGGWLNNQILHSVGQIVMLLGEPGESVDGKKRFIPLKLETGQRGVLSLAVKRLYQKYRVAPETPAWGTPTLTDLIAVLEEMHDPIAVMFATRLRYFIYGSLTDTTEKTPDGAAFDGQTTIDWRFEDRIVYYDFKTVPELLLPLFYVQAMGKAWRYITTRRISHDIFLQIDEFGYASQVEAVANTAWVMAKTARKYRLGMVLVDQTMRPFLDTPAGRQLHANAAAHFFFHMQDVEAQDVARAMSVITPRHQQFIIDAEPGQCLGVIRKDVYEINVECHALEASAFLNS
ncbi:MAG: hypothetical protein HGA45_01865 [Chloroflexales bacterium]|nr:hypothetical protein [Chloroflexales bacterium]